MIDNIITLSTYQPSEKPLRVVFQKNGRLTELSRNAFIKRNVDISTRDKEIMPAVNANMVFNGVRDDDVPKYVAAGIAQFGIVGTNVLKEKFPNNKNIEIIQVLPTKPEDSFRMSLAFPAAMNVTSKTDLTNKKYATSYPNMLQRYFDENKIDATEIVTLEGGTELAVSLGLADGVCDLVQSGSTLKKYGLVEYDTIANFEIVVIANREFWQNAKNMGQLGKEIAMLPPQGWKHAIGE